MSKYTNVINFLEEKEFDAAAKTLADGGLVVFPTETVYGLGANALDTKAVEGIFKAKNRPADNPLIVHISKIEDSLQLVEDFPQKAKDLTDKFWPGPLTIILKKSRLIPDIVSAGLDSVAIRMPGNKIALSLIDKAGVPVAAPSANISGSPSPTTAKHCIDDLNGRVDYIIDGGNSDVGVESTVISFIENKPLLLRPGGVTVRDIEDVIGKIDISDAVFNQIKDNQQVVSPGLKHKHYSPKARVVLVNASSSDFISYCNSLKEKDAAAIAFNDELEFIKIPAIGYGLFSDQSNQAQLVFASLREADRPGTATIYVHAPNKEGIGLAVYNRLIRAADFNEITI